jgi:hypothetical protein
MQMWLKTNLVYFLFVKSHSNRLNVCTDWMTVLTLWPKLYGHGVSCITVRLKLNSVLIKKIQTVHSIISLFPWPQQTHASA